MLKERLNKIESGVATTIAIDLRKKVGKLSGEWENLDENSSTRSQENTIGSIVETGGVLGAKL